MKLIKKLNLPEKTESAECNFIDNSQNLLSMIKVGYYHR